MNNLVFSDNHSGLADISGNIPRSRQSQRNASRVMQFEQTMFDHRSRYLVIVLTLNYQKAYRNWISLEVIQQHRDQFLKNQRSNQLLAGIEGYVWKIEEGENSGGLHMHLVIFYSGKHRADVLIAQAIGEYWKHEITGGIGDYRNSNSEKDRHALYGHGIGTGQINRNDLEKRASLLKNLLYLIKDEQRVSSKTSPHHRLFGTSQFPR